jgi:hypothetical protein
MHLRINDPRFPGDVKEAISNRSARNRDADGYDPEHIIIMGSERVKLSKAFGIPLESVGYYFDNPHGYVIEPE